MTTDKELIARWQGRAEWISREWYTLGDMASGCEIDMVKAGNVNRQIVSSGDAERQIRNGVYRYRRAADNTWLAKPWRRHTNEQLGITRYIPDYC